METSAAPIIYAKIKDNIGIITVLLAIGGILIMILLLYNAGKKAGVLYAEHNQDPLPNEGATIPAGWAGQEKNYAAQLYAAINGWAGTANHALVLLVAQLNALTDDQLIAISNEWNAAYAPQYGNYNLPLALQGEWAGGEPKSVLIARYAQLGVPPKKIK